MLRQDRRSSLAAALLATPLLLIALAACAGAPPTDNPGPQKSPVADAGQWALDFAECMRAEGIDMEDPNSNGGVVAMAPSDETPERQAATETCIEKLGPSPAGNGSRGAGGGPSAEEMHEQLLEMAACLRDLGFDVADPKPGEGVGMPAGLTDEALEQCAEFAPSAVPAQ
jgi:hypothetical protein